MADIGLILDILDAGYAAAGAGPPPSLLQILKCYEAILQRRGIATSADNGAYRLLLAVSLQPPTSWYEKLHREMSRLGLPSDLRLRGRLAEAAMRPSAAPAVPAGGTTALPPRELSTTAGTLTRSSLSATIPAPPPHASSRRPSAAAAAATPRPPEPPRPPLPLPAAWTPADDPQRSGGGGGFSASSTPGPSVKPLPDDDYGIRAPDGGSMADFIRFRRRARYFRRWVAAAVVQSEKRRIAVEIDAMKVAAFRAARDKRTLADSFRALALGCSVSARERAQTLRALEHWSQATTRRFFTPWRWRIVADRPEPLYHPVHIRSLFKWIALTLVDRGGWWRLAAQTQLAGGSAVRPVGTEMRGDGTVSRGRSFSVGDGGRGGGAAVASQGTVPFLAASYAQSRAISAGATSRFAAPPALRRHSLTELEHGSLRAALATAEASVLRHSSSSRGGGDTRASRARASSADQAGGGDGDSVHTAEILGGGGGGAVASASALAGDVLAAAQLREQRLGRLRGYVVGRIAPTLRKLPLLEHATAIVDAHVIVHVFAGWRAWAAAARSVRLRNEFARRGARVFAAWRAAATKCRALRAATGAGALLHSGFSLGRAWFAWRRALDGERLARALVARAVEHAPTLAARHATRVWRRWLFLNKTTRRARAVKNRRLLRASLSRWGAGARSLATRKERVRRATKTVALARLYRVWRRVRAAWALLQAGAAFRARRSRVNALRAWRAGAALSLRAFAVRQRCAAIVARASLKALRQVLGAQDRASASAGAAVDRRRGVAALAHWARRCAGRRAFRAASKLVARGTARRAVAVWRASSGRSRSAAHHLVASRQRLLFLHASQMLCRWRAKVAHSRVDILRCEVLGRLSVRSAGRWALRLLGKHLKHRRRQKELARRSIARVIGDAVSRWRVVARHRARLRLRVAAFTSSLAASRHKTIIRTWAATAVLTRRKAHLVTVQASFATLRLLRRAWRAFRERRRRILALAAAGEALHGRIKETAASRVLQAWDGLVRRTRLERRYAASCATALANSRALRSLRAWWRIATARATVRRRAALAARHICLHKEHSAVVHWHHLARREAAARHAATIVTARAAQAVTRACTTAWLGALLRRRRLRTLSVQGAILVAKRHTLSALATWQSFVRHRRARRREVRRSAALLTAASARRALVAWAAQGRAAAERRVFCGVAGARLVALRAAQLVRIWRQRTAAAASRREDRARAKRVRQLRVLGIAWRGWEAFVVAKRAARAAAEVVAAEVTADAMRVVWRAWARFAAVFAAKRRFAAAAALRIRRLRLHVALGEWRLASGTQALRRRQLGAAAATERTRAAERALRGWRLAIVRRRRREALLPSVAATYARERRLVGLHAWAARVAEARRHEAAVARAVALYTHREQRKAFDALVAHAAARRRWHRRKELARDRKAKADARRGLRRWRLAARASHAGGLVALRARRSALAAHMGAWLGLFRTLCALRQRGTALATGLAGVITGHRLARSFAAWALYRRACRLDNARVAAIQRRCALRAARAHLSAWHDVFAAQREGNRAAVSRAFASWLHFHGTLRAGRTLTVKLLARHAVATLRDWRDAALELRGAKAVAVRLGPALAAGGPPAEFARRCKRAVMRWRRMDLAPAWSAWRAYLDERRRKRALATAADELHRVRVEHRHWQAWASVLTAQQRRRGRLVANTFRAWVAVAAAAASRRAVDADRIARVGRSVAAVRTRAVLGRMAALVAEAEGRRATAEVMFVAQQARLCASALSAWRALREHRAVTRGLGRVLSTRLILRSLGRIVVVWHDAALHERWAKDRADAFRLRRLLALAWTPWAAYATHRARARRCYARAAEMWAGLRTSRVRDALLFWRDWKRSVDTAARSAGVIEARSATALLRVTFSSWVSERSRRAAIAAAAVTVSARTARALSTASLTRWRLDARRSRRIRHGLEAIVSAADLRGYRAAIAEWRAQAWTLRCKRRGIERLFDTSARRILADAVVEWAIWTREDAAEESRVRLAVSHRQATLLAAAVTTWRASRDRRSHLRRLETLQHARSQRARTATAFAVWRARFALAQLRHGLTADMRERWLAALLRGVMREWFTAAHRRRAVFAVGSAVAASVASGTARRIFEAWHRGAREQLLEKAAKAQWALTLERRAFGGWQRFIRLQRLEARWARRLEHGAVSLWRRFSRVAKQHRLAAALRRRVSEAVLREWRRRLHAVVGARVAHAAAVGRLAAMAAGAALRRWRHSTYAHRLVRERVARFRRAWVRQTFAALHAYAVHARSKRERLWAARTSLATSCAARVMGAWSAVAKAGKAYRAALALQQEMRLRMERKIDAARLATVAVAFARWSQCIRATIASRRLARRFQLHTRVRRLTVTWAAWAAKKHRARGLSVRLGRIARAGVLSRAWNALTAAAEDAARERRLDAIATRFARGLALRRHASVVRFWRHTAAGAVALRRAAGEVAARRLLQTLTAWRLLAVATRRGRERATAAVFRAWQRSTTDARAKRDTAARAVAAAVLRKSWALAFGTWHRLAAVRRTRRAALAATEAAVSVLLVGRAAQRCLRGWAAAARRAAGCRALVKRRPALLARRAIRRWTLHARLSAHRELQAGKAAWFHARRLLSVALAAWRGQCYSAAGPEKRAGAAARVLAAQEAADGSGGGWESPDGGDSYSRSEHARLRQQQHPHALHLDRGASPVMTFPAPAYPGGGAARDGSAADGGRAAGPRAPEAPQPTLLPYPSAHGGAVSIAQQQLQQLQQLRRAARATAEVTLDKDPGHPLAAGAAPGAAASTPPPAGTAAARRPRAGPAAAAAEFPGARGARAGLLPGRGLDDERITRYRRSSLAGGSSPASSRLLGGGGGAAAAGAAAAAPSSSARKGRQPQQHRSLSPSALLGWGARGGGGPPPSPLPPPRPDAPVATPARPRAVLPPAVPLTVLPRFASRTMSPLSTAIGGPGAARQPPAAPPAAAGGPQALERSRRAAPPEPPPSPALAGAAGLPLTASSLQGGGGDASGGSPPRHGLWGSGAAAGRPSPARPPPRSLGPAASAPAWLRVPPTLAAAAAAAAPPPAAVDLGAAPRAAVQQPPPPPPPPPTLASPSAGFAPPAAPLPPHHAAPANPAAALQRHAPPAPLPPRRLSGGGGAAERKVAPEGGEEAKEEEQRPDPTTAALASLAAEAAAHRRPRREDVPAGAASQAAVARTGGWQIGARARTLPRPPPE